MKIEFTPGPWTVAAGDDESGYGILGAGKPLRGINPRNASISEDVGRAFKRADAQLFAAAPDLYEVCSKWADIIQGGDKMERLEPWAQECVQELKAALSKAEGR